MRHNFRLGSSSMRFSIILLLLAALLLTAPGALAQGGVDLIVHFIDSTYVPGKNAYQVQAYLSVLDEDGRPVKGLSRDNFTLTEDSRKVEIDQVQGAEAPISIVLVLDTSGSMSGAIADARLAAKSFVSSLSSGDRVALISFNQKITRLKDFTEDLTSVNTAIDSIKAIPDAGTCLYDVAYDAIQLSGTSSQGRRAVVLLTDGVDEIIVNGARKPCSSHVIEDVINLASQGNTRTPVYTLGLGGQTDDKSLSRLAQMTGGSFLKSPDAASLNIWFGRLSETLKSEYVLTYFSSSAPGAHTAILQVDVSGAQDIDTRNLVNPPLPAQITILSPVQDQKIVGEVVIQADVSSQGKTVAEVIFQLNGQEVGRDETFPYSIEFEDLAPGSYDLEVAAAGEDGSELARARITFEVIPSAPVEEIITPTITLPAAATAAPTETPQSTPLVVGMVLGGAGLLALLAAVIVLIVMINRKKQAPALTSSTFPEVTPTLRQGAPSAPEVLATLTVLHSDDPGMINQVLNITKPNTLIGRGAQNDLIFPKDTPVSRQHAIIEQKGYQFWVSEACSTDETGALKRPKFGTFLNETKLEEAPVLLKKGDVVRLGSRVRLKFETPLVESLDDDRTLDGLSDMTMDGIGNSTRSPVIETDSTLPNPISTEPTQPDRANDANQTLPER